MATIADIHPIRTALAGLEAGAPLTHGALTAVPLLAPPDLVEPDWLTLDEAGDAVTITEVGEGSVPDLGVRNAGDREVLLLDGEELVGAKQDRILNTTVLVAAGAAITIPVSCVEEGRWRYRGSRHFRPSPYGLFASARSRKAARVSESLRRRKRHVSDQVEVWADVARLSAGLRVASPTGALHDVYERYADEVGRAWAALAARPRQRGAAVFLGSDWIGLDLLPGPRLFASAWPRLLAGYAAEALGTVSPAGRADVSAVLGAIEASAAERAPAVGLGEEYRLGAEDGSIVGAALVAGDTVAHLMAFPNPGARG